MKTIKSIRILDSKSPSVRKSLSSQKQPPQIFSFSKKDTNKFLKHVTDEEINNQKQEIGKLQRMIKGMLKKCQTQNEEVQLLSQEYQQWKQQQEKNQHHRRELMELKELMKSLLMESEKVNCLQFYQELL